MEHACRSKRLPDYVRCRDYFPDPQGRATDLAHDVVGRDDTGDAGEVGAGDAGRSETVHRGPGIDEAGRRFDEPALAQIEIVTHRCRYRITVSPDGLVGEGKGRVVQVDIIELLANHQVGKEASLGGDKIGAEEGDFELVAEAGIVGGSRAEIAGRGPQMQIPAVVVETRDVGADLRAREGLGLSIVAVGGRGIDDGAALGRNADGIRRGAEVHLAADAAGPYAAAWLIRHGIGRRRYEGAALLGEESRIDVADRRRNRRAGGAGRDRKRADVGDRERGCDLRGRAILGRRGEWRRHLGARFRRRQQQARHHRPVGNLPLPAHHPDERIVAAGTPAMVSRSAGSTTSFRSPRSRRKQSLRQPEREEPRRARPAPEAPRARQQAVARPSIVSGGGGGGRTQAIIGVGHLPHCAGLIRAARNLRPSLQLGGSFDGPLLPLDVAVRRRSRRRDHAFGSTAGLGR